MSISVSIIGNDGIVLATDSRVTIRSLPVLTHHDTATKLWDLGGVVGLMTVNDNRGFSEWLVESYKKRQLTKENMEKQQLNDFEGIALNFSYFLNQMFTQYVKDTPQQFLKSQGYELGFTIAGYDSSGDPKIQYLSSYDSFTPNLVDNYHVAGIPGVGDYWMARLHKHLFGVEAGLKVYKMGLQGLKVLATTIISETAQINEHVGGNIQMATINKDLGFLRIETVEVERINKDVEELTDERKIVKYLESYN